MTATTTPTITDLLAAAERAWGELEALLDRLEPALSTGPDAGGWDVRHLLSHLVGAWQRIPVHAGFFVSGADFVPIQVHDSYWIAEWETATLASFTLAMRAAYAANIAFLHTLDPALLGQTRPTPFGELTLGELLLTSYDRHIGQMHTPQLADFIKSGSN